jgi:nucleotide-binding universal stress UspA family protein
MCERVLVVFEPGRAGAATIDTARELIGEGRQLTVVCVAPQAPSGPRCGNSALDYNDALIDATRADLHAARELLGDAGHAAAFELLLEGVDPPVHELAARGRFDLVLLPARRRPLRSCKHPAATPIRAGGIEVRVVDPAAPSPI